MPPETTSDSPAIEAIRDQIDTLRTRREEYVRWIETYDRTRTAPTSVADWVRQIECFDHSINELGLLMRNLREAGL